MAEIQRVFQSKAETKAFYDKISHVYDLLAEHSEGPIRRAGLEKLDARPGEKALEIGFGTGHCLVSLAQSVGPTGKVYGLDLSERMLDVAQDNLPLGENNVDGDEEVERKSGGGDQPGPMGQKKFHENDSC